MGEREANLDMTDSMGPGKLVRHMPNQSYTYDTHLLCMGLGRTVIDMTSIDISMTSIDRSK